MTMFYGAQYDTRSGSVYVNTCTIILKLKYFVVNNVLFYNTLVRVYEHPNASELLDCTTNKLIENIYFLY